MSVEFHCLALLTADMTFCTAVSFKLWNVCETSENIWWFSFIS